jgi:superfamily II DNA/RNA helicase
MTEVQYNSINKILEHNDVLIKAPTGSGKTLSFIIPSIQNITKNHPNNKINFEN